MADKIYVIGDIHGSFKPIMDFYNRNKEKENFDGTDVIICLGDFCMNYFLNDRDKIAKRYLGNYPFTYFVIRGNHEERPGNCMKGNPDAWNIETFFDGSVYVEKEFPYIKYATDGPGLYQIAKYKTLVLPGAYSVDKNFRLAMGYQWFEEEQMTEAELVSAKELAKNITKCDLVLSHTCPFIFEPTDLFLSSIDQSKVDKTMERAFGEIEFLLDYKAWMWGHYHAFRDYPRKDGHRKLMLYSQELVNLEDYMEKDNVEKL